MVSPMLKPQERARGSCCPNGTDRHEIAIDSTIVAAQETENGIAERLHARGVGERDLFAIRLSLHEALLNAVRHGNRLASDKQVRVAVDLNGSCCTVEVEDEGRGFCPGDVDDPRLDQYLDKPGGRGLLLIRTFMDSVHFNERGNRITMVKRYSKNGHSSE